MTGIVLRKKRADTDECCGSWRNFLSQGFTQHSTITTLIMCYLPIKSLMSHLPGAISSPPLWLSDTNSRLRTRQLSPKEHQPARHAKAKTNRQLA